IDSGRYDNSIFHRLAINPDNSRFVLQGGGFKLQENPSTITTIPTDATVQNEFGASNTIGTLAMAKVGNDPNSATDQFFINLNNNSANLDNQNGGFTVFGRLVGAADQAVLNALVDSPATVTVKNESASNGAFDNIPMINYNGNNFPTDTTSANYDIVKSVTIVRQNEELTYSVTANTNPGLVTATINNNRLTLNYTPNQSGTATITVLATDKFGATVQTSFNVTVT
ncbi:MAG TPA: peptidylprolyl isomerase, partial [Gemmataceae bacterium]|nr:peptidylprolyl isomerase [Gemmataceae bacterium]